MVNGLKKVLFIGCLAVLAACTVAPHQESAGEYLDSAATTAKVKANLVDKLGSSGFSIQVKTYKDEVQLSGFVHSRSLKTRAGAVTENTAGVVRVRNDLIVR